VDDRRIRNDIYWIDDEERARRNHLDWLDGADYIRACNAPLDEQVERMLLEAARQTSEKWEILANPHHFPGGRISSRADLVFLPRASGAGVEGPATSASQRSDPVAVETQPTLPTAPRICEVLVGLFCSRVHREAILGDLAEKFEARALSNGARRARAWYWWQVARSFGPFAWRWGRRLVALDGLRRLIGL
jgi:hypothetical protein